jgi:hypothetical protein
MPSPFPGMDPYLEKSWGDVHNRLITYAADQLQTRLPRDLRARIEERVYVDSALDPAEYYPDVRVVERPQRAGAGSPSGLAGSGEVSGAQPVVVDLTTEPVTEAHIEIIDIATGRKVITSIEMLSPSNKRPGKGRKSFLKKQRQLRAGRVNTVEIDLLRSGRRAMVVPAYRIPPAWRTLYQVCVWRARRPEQADVYRISLRERLPSIRIPLRRTDDEVMLDLQELIARAYDNGGYDDIDYHSEPDPPLDPGDAAWADTLLRERGLR